MDKKVINRKNKPDSIDLVKRAEELKIQSEDADLEQCIYILGELQEVLSETMIRIGDEKIGQDEISNIYTMYECINKTAKKKIKETANK
jgi:hypothetical protein